MSDEIMAVLMSLKEGQGRIEQKIDGHVKAFDEHVDMDMKAYAAISELRQGVAKQKGFLTAVGVMGSGLGAALGWLVEKTLGIGHH